MEEPIEEIEMSGEEEEDATEMEEEELEEPEEEIEDQEEEEEILEEEQEEEEDTEKIEVVEEEEVEADDDEEGVEILDDDEDATPAVPKRKTTYPKKTSQDNNDDVDLDLDNDLDDFDYDDDLLDDVDYDRDTLYKVGYDVDEGEDEEGAVEEELLDSEEEEHDSEEGESEEDSEEAEEGDEDEDEEALEEEEIMDEATLELRARELSLETFEKEEHILAYLYLMRRVQILHKHNLYIGDYLTRLCLRKKLIKDPSSRPFRMKFHRSRKSRRVTRGKSQHSHHHHHHHHESAAVLPKRGKTPYELFRDTRPSEDFVRKVGPDRNTLRRARQLKPNPKAPSYLRKVEVRVVNIHGTQFQRVLRSKGRNWREDVIRADGEDGNRPGGRKGREIALGHPDVPRANQRTLLPFKKGKRKNVEGEKNLKKKRHQASSFSARNNKGPRYDPNYQFGPGKGALRRRSSSGGRRSSRMRMSAGGLRLRSFTSQSGGRMSLIVPSKSPKLPCGGGGKKRFIRFRSPRWFPSGGSSLLKGRKLNARSLLESIQQGVPSWEALLNLENKRGRKARDAAKPSQPPLPPGQQAAEDWALVLGRLYILLEKKAQAERKHVSALKEKLATWKNMEAQNGEMIRELFSEFRDFIQAGINSSFTGGEIRNFKREVGAFGGQLHGRHVSLMVQLFRYYRAKLNLVLYQRQLKNKTNPGLAKLGYSIADYEPRLVENSQLFETLQKKEKELEAQGDQLGTRMKDATRGRRILQGKAAALHEGGKGIQALEEEAVKGSLAASGAMWKYKNILKRNKLFLLGASVVEKTHLLQDFTTRKRAMQHFEVEVHKRDLDREVYQRERELKGIQVKSANVARDLAQLRAEKVAAQRAKEYRLHVEWMKGGKNMEDACIMALARCGGTKNKKKNKKKTVK